MLAAWDFSVRECYRRDFSDLTEIFIFFNARYTKRDAPTWRAVSEALKK